MSEPNANKPPETRNTCSKCSHLSKLHAIALGLGVNETNGALGGIVRTTASLPGRREHVHEGRVPFASDAGGIYGSNIQIAELNALNAIFAVLKWKKIRGVYHDAIEELHSLYTIDGNDIVNVESLVGRSDAA